MKKDPMFVFSFVQKHSIFVLIRSKEKKANPYPIKLNNFPMNRKYFVKKQKF